MSSMVLEMPVMTGATVASPRRAVVQKRVDTLYGERFAGLMNHYRIRDSERVKAFLRQHSHLIAMLEEGRPIVDILFGAETLITLRLQRDPDVGQENLIAHIQNDLPATESVERLLELSDLWLGERLSILDDRLIFTI